MPITKNVPGCGCGCSAGSAVVFRLVNPCGGGPFVGASVTLYDPTGATVVGTRTTDSNGCVNFGTFATPVGTAYPFTASVPYASRYLIPSNVASVAATATCPGSYGPLISVNTSSYVCDPSGVCTDPISKTLHVSYVAGYPVGPGPYAESYQPAGVFPVPGFPGWHDAASGNYLYWDGAWYDVTGSYIVTTTCSAFGLSLRTISATKGTVTE